MFPIIKTIEDVEESIQSYPNFVKKTHEINGRKLISICYSFIDDKTFIGEGSDIRKECRGILFDGITGEVISRPFHKFFNVNENEEVLFRNIDWNQVKEVQNKFDGSLFIPVRVKGNIYWKTKNSFDFDHLFPNIKQVSSKYNDLISFLLGRHLTPLFEGFCYKNKVVVDYGDTNFWFLAARHNWTGEYFELSDMLNMVDCKPFYDLILESKRRLLELPVEIDVSKSGESFYLQNSICHLKDYEGVVVVLKNGQRYKLKTKWYYDLHTFISKEAKSCSKLISYVINETIDEVKSVLVENKLDAHLYFLKKVEEITVDVLLKIIFNLDEFLKDNKLEDRKEYASRVLEWSKKQEGFKGVYSAVLFNFYDNWDKSTSDMVKDFYNRPSNANFRKEIKLYVESKLDYVPDQLEEL